MLNTARVEQYAWSLYDRLEIWRRLSFLSIIRRPDSMNHHRRFPDAI
jgi:hypothetical protein